MVKSSEYLKQVYIGGTSSNKGNYEANKGRYGDALYETSTASNGSKAWYSGYSIFPCESLQFFTRGGYYNRGSDAGAFVFYHNSGDSHSYYSFRPVLIL